jgi:uncharacterized membrane protein
MRIIRIVLAALVIAAPAQAGLKVCNKGKFPARMALGHFDGKDWSSQGWWTIAPAACADVVKTPLNARYYYLYGTDTASGVWDGETSFCVSRAAKFQISGRADCTKRGYDRQRFFTVDTQDNLNKVVPLQ